MKRLFLYSKALAAASLFLTPAIVSFGQDAAQPGVAEDEVQRIIGIKIYGWPYRGAIENDTVITQVPKVYFDSEGQEKPADVTRMRTTGTYRVTAVENQVIFYTKKETVHPETGEIVQVKVPRIQATIPESWDNALLVVFPDAMSGESYKTVPMDASLESTPDGMVRMVNGTKDTLALDAGGERIVLNPSESTLFVPKVETDGKSFYVQMLRETDKGWKRIYYSYAKLDEDRANLMVIYPSGGRRVQIRNFGDIR